MDRPVFKVNDPIIYPWDQCLDYKELHTLIHERLPYVNRWLKSLVDSGDSLPICFRSKESSNAHPDSVLSVSEEMLHEKSNVWFIGDIHGDILSLQLARAIIYKITEKEGRPKPVFVYLGDLVDRLKYSFETLFCVLNQLCLNEDVIWLAGNHDILKYTDEPVPRFYSGVQPSEYCDWLNSPPENNPWADDWEEVITLSRLYVQLQSGLPSAAYFPPGILAAHGGVPHSDLQPTIQTWSDLSRPESLQDFTWVRLSKAKKKFPNRMSKGCQMGVSDFNGFLNCMDAMGKPVGLFLRGHDHFPERFVQMPKYKPTPVYTINTVCCTADGAVGGTDFYTNPAIIAYDAAKQTLQPYLIQAPSQTVDLWHGRET